jgi:hypothetical protein
MKLELSIHAVKLRNVAGLFQGTSDPFAVVTKLASTTGSKPVILGQTEVLYNTLEKTEWVKVFHLDYELGTPTRIAVQVFDAVSKGTDKPMGMAVFDIGELLGSRGNTKAKRLSQGGAVFAHVRKSLGSGLLRLKVKGTKLKNVEGCFGKSDPFFELSRKVDSLGGFGWDNVFRSRSIKDNLNPEWELAAIDLSTLCDADLDRSILVTVYDDNLSSGKHVSMGQFETTVNDILQNTQFKLTRKGKDVGTIKIVSATVDGMKEVSEQMARVAVSAPLENPSISTPYKPCDRHSFVDYISGGCKLNVMVAIDFTASNGNPRTPGTLHHSSSYKNDYEKAISAILGSLAKYDSDRMFPVVGFGAKHDGVLRHCFQCGTQEEVHDVAGVLEAYRGVFSSGLIMSEPTVLTEVIEAAAARAACTMKEADEIGLQAYSILLILTDGGVADVQATAASLNQASDAPLSIVIVGVGDADFSSMQFLDDCSKPGTRDIAQFVQFNKHSHDSVALTSETLKEIPNQLVDYFQSKSIAPLPPIKRSDSEITTESDDEEFELNLDMGSGEIVITSGGESRVNDFNGSK